MEKKGKSMGKDKGRERQHKHSYAHRGFPRFSSYSGRFTGEALDNVPDPKSKLLVGDKLAFERAPWLNLEAPLLLNKIASQWESGNNKNRAKFVVNVRIAQSIGHLRVFVSNDATVVHVIKATLAEYAKEGRRPSLGSDPLSFRLHYSQFTVDCLNSNDKMEDLACRNFYLCPKTTIPEVTRASVGNCGTGLENSSTMTDPWYTFMDCFLLLL